MMSKKSFEKIPLPSVKSFWVIAAILTVVGLALIFIGLAFASDSVWRVVFHAVGGAVIGLGWVEVLHEWAVAKKVREEFLVLGDFIEKGIERVCTGEEIAEEGRRELSNTKSLKVIGIGVSWLVKDDNYIRLQEMLENKYPVRVIIPDPCAREIIERYANDEPPEFDLGLSGLAARIKTWYNLSKKYDTLEVRVYTRYPVANVTIYDDHLYVAPVLYKRRAKDNLTAIFRRPSKGAEAYEDHFNKVYVHGSLELNDAYLAKLNEQYPEEANIGRAKLIAGSVV